MSTLRLMIVFCGLLPVHLLVADELSQSGHYVINAWRTDSGLPANEVTAIVQGSKGYLWVGTADGLARFDGVRFTTFRSSNTPNLRSNHILSLYQAPDQTLWIGTADGLMCLDNGHFTAFTTEDGLSSEQVLCAGEDDRGQLWVGTATGLNRWDRNRFTSFFAREGLPDNRINAIASFEKRDLVFATGHGLARFGGVRFGPYAPVLGMPQGDIRMLQVDSEGNLWLVDRLGLWCIRLHGLKPESSLIYRGSVSSLAAGPFGSIWFGTATGDLLDLPTGNRSGTPVQVASFPSAITSLCEDCEHDLWLGTASNGLYRLKRRQLDLFRIPEGIGSQGVSSLVIMPGDQMWLVSSSGTLCRWTDGQVFPLAELPKAVHVRTLCGSAKSGLWIGTLSVGLFCWKSGRLRHWTELDGLSDNDIEALCSDRLGGVWLGTRNGGLNHLRNGHLTRFLTPWGFTGNYACALARDHSGRIWIGTTGDGLFCLSNAVFSSYTTGNGLPDNQVRTLLTDSDGVLWVGTASGLVRIKDNQLTTFTKLNGLTDDGICQLESDGLGNLWVGCNSGLFRLSKTQLRDYAEGRNRFLDPIPYGKSDGLPVLQCVPGMRLINASGHRMPLWFATSKGLVRVEPWRLHWNRLPPPVRLEKVLLDNNPVPLAHPIHVPPGTRRIQFEYSALSLVAPVKTRFRCRLFGFDRSWVQMGDNRKAVYTQVPPGNYRFQVQACNNDGVWNLNGASVSLIAAPFWWETAWFKLGALALLGTFVFGLIRQRQIRLRELERLRVRLAGDLHDELGSSLWSIALLSQSLQKYGRMGQEERGDVGEIHRMAKQVSNAIRDIVWIINPAFDTTEDLVLRMKDFAGTILRGLDCRLQYEGVDLSRQLALDFRQNVFLMFKELLTNVAKHAQAGRVEICLEEHPEVWQLRIRDDGVGFDASAPPDGNGLPSLRRRADKIGATVHIDSGRGKGTTVMLTIPKR